MKNKFFISCLLLCFCILCAHESHGESLQYEWIDSKEVAVLKDGFYIDSNKGPMLINVVEYDQINDRYLIECPRFDDYHPTS